jgi:hypothetical protein
MKYTNIFSVVMLTVALTMFTVVSCDKDIDETEFLSPLAPKDLDVEAGNWTMKALVSSSSFDAVVVAPAAVGSDAYKAELAAIKDAQSKLTSSQRKIIAYWSGGGVLRWNQILREMVAKYNLPPAPRDDDSYPIPDAENPFADPNFPFSNPPYAARAYAYVSVAQFEALKAAWHYKYLYNRAAPYTNDSGIEALVPKLIYLPILLRMLFYQV